MAQMTANTRFSDIVLDDAALSMAAKGIFVTVGYIGNGCTLQRLEGYCREDPATLRAAAEELVAAGYVTFEGEELHIKAAPSFGVLG